MADPDVGRALAAATNESLAARLPTMTSLAEYLGADLAHLNTVLYGVRPEHFYKHWRISKKTGGTRLISAPTSTIYYWQSKLIPLLSEAYEARASTHGYVVGRSIV